MPQLSNNSWTMNSMFLTLTSMAIMVNMNMKSSNSPILKLNKTIWMSYSMML